MPQPTSNAQTKAQYISRRAFFAWWVSGGVKLLGMKEQTLVDIDCVVVETAPNPQVSVIWLHGLGADGHDFVPIVPQLVTAKRVPMRFVFPNAPRIPVSINQGIVMPAWYDILGFDVSRDQDEAGIMASVKKIDRLIEHESSSPGIQQVVLAGFSQGGAIALRAGLATHHRLAGIIALSTYLLNDDRLNDWRSPVQDDTHVFMGHGQSDPIVPLALGQSAHRALSEAGFQVRWQTWPMGHEVCPEEIQRVDDFLTACCQSSRATEPTANANP